MLLHVYLIEYTRLHRDFYNLNGDITRYNSKGSTFRISSLYIDQLCNQHNKRDWDSKGLECVTRFYHT